MAVADQIAAQAAKDALAKELQGKFNYVDTAYTQAQDAARANTQNILNQLTQKGTEYQEQFGEDSRSAYINKMQANQKLEGELSRLGLGNSGYGVTQRLQSETAYGKNLTELQKALNKNMLGIDQAKATAQTELGNTLADMAQKQASTKLGIDQYIINQLQNAYDTAYDRSYKERMDAEALAASRSYGGGSGGGYYSRGSGGSDYSSGVVAYGNLANSYGDGKGNVIYTDKDGNTYKMKQGYNPYTGTINSDAKKVTFANGYQPDNIGGTKLSSTGKTTPVNGQNQKIWKADGTYYYWDGTANRYYKCTNAQLKAAGLKK